MARYPAQIQSGCIGGWNSAQGTPARKRVDESSAATEASDACINTALPCSVNGNRSNEAVAETTAKNAAGIAARFVTIEMRLMLWNTVTRTGIVPACAATVNAIMERTH